MLAFHSVRRLQSHADDCRRSIRNAITDTIAEMYHIELIRIKIRINDIRIQRLQIFAGLVIAGQIFLVILKMAY